jgi:methylmalonyl-CoA mutase cobalamin-binding subunit
MQDSGWIPGFLSGDVAVLQKDGMIFSTREEAADAALASTPKHQIVVAHRQANHLRLFEATRKKDGTWIFVAFPNLSRVLGD